MKLHEIFNISDLEDQFGVCVIENAFDGIVEGVDYTLENIPACHDDVTRTVIGEASKKNWQDKSYREKRTKLVLKLMLNVLHGVKQTRVNVLLLIIIERHRIDRGKLNAFNRGKSV
ncbi:UNVERIFIED_ORG: hypothetical protein GCAPEGMB_00125 [Vibrio phage V07]